MEGTTRRQIAGISKAEQLVLLADISGTFLFAISGAEVAIQNHLDLLGILVLGFCTALGGGIIRDVLIGATPPAALQGWVYTTVAFAGALLTFLVYPVVREIPRPVFITLDACGLALFAVAGAQKALEYGLTPFVAVLLGAITATGGGSVREIMLAHVPPVLRVDLYATSALAGAAAMVLLQRAGLTPGKASLTGGGVCFLLRLLSVWLHWHLPVLRMS